MQRITSDPETESSATDPTAAVDRTTSSLSDDDLAGPLTRRERQHIEVVRLVLSGERERATVLGREHLREFPDDIVVAQTLASHGLA